MTISILRNFLAIGYALKPYTL